MIVVNFKTYKESSGNNAIDLAKMINDVSGNTGVEIVSCPQAVDLREVVKATNHPVWVQHVDVAERGRATGWFPPEIAKEAGARGVLINHSEHKLSVGQLGETMTRCKNVGLETLILADTVEEAVIARSKPEIIERVVKAIQEVPILVGAGIKDKNDVLVSLKRGAKGIVPSSAVIKAENPQKVLEDLAEGFK
jgi:triosephosphate isomerase